MRYYRMLPALALLVVLPQAGQSQYVYNAAPTRVFGHLLTEIRTVNPNLVEGRELYLPAGVAIDRSSNPPRLYVADSLNNRVLGWANARAFENGQTADVVIGQRDLFSTISGGPLGDDKTRSSGLLQPVGVAVDSEGNLFVADAGNNRILRFKRPFDQPDPVKLADLVIGQPNLNAGLSNQGGPRSERTVSLNPQNRTDCLGCQAAHLAFDPDTGDLYFTDAGNHRVLRYRRQDVTGEGLSNQPAADLVLGQSDYSSATIPAIDAAGQRQKTLLRGPSGLSFGTEGRLYVADEIHRVLVFEKPFSNGKAASRILGVVPSPAAGQPSPPAINEYSLSGPRFAFEFRGKVFVLDYGNSRMLRFAHPAEWPAESVEFSPKAEVVFGQSTFNTGQANRGEQEASSTSFAMPAAASVLDDEVFVADALNHRVLALPSGIAEVAAGARDVPAVRLLGQPFFNLRSPNLADGRGLNTLYFGTTDSLAGVAIDSTSDPPRLYVADFNNNRVLGFADARKVKQGMAADLVIGQPDLLRTVRNWPSPAGDTRNAASLYLPTDVAVDKEGNLWVADAGNGRVLRFPRPFDRAGQPQSADLVIGQADFSSRVTDATARNLNFPAGIAFSSEGHLVVSDANHNRVLLFLSPFSNGQAASRVFGQPDFTSTAAGNQADKFNSPRHLALDSNNRLYVADYGNNRVQVFPSLLTGGNGPIASVSITHSLSLPSSVSIDPSSGEVWVASTNNNRIYRYREYTRLSLGDLTPTALLGDKTALFRPITVSFDSYRNILVIDEASRMLMFYPGLGLTNAGNYFSYLAPGTIAVAWPLGAPVTTEQRVNDQRNWPKVLSDVEVLVNETPAPLYYVYPSQIGFLVPQNAPQSGTAQVVVQRKSTGQVFAAGGALMAPASPALFTMSQDGRGQVAALNNLHLGAVIVNGTANPIERGGVLSLFGTGYGLVPGHPEDGVAPEGAVWTPGEKPIIVIEGWGQPITGEAVLYSGLAPGLPGVWQINFVVPRDMVFNNQPVRRIAVYFKDFTTNRDPVSGAVIDTTIVIK